MASIKLTGTFVTYSVEIPKKEYTEYKKELITKQWSGKIENEHTHEENSVEMVNFLVSFEKENDHIESLRMGLELCLDEKITIQK
jgi:hypothetical protein